MEFKGTQGNWKTYKPSTSNGWINVITEKQKHEVCTCYNGLAIYDFNEVEANAQLIATAPELLKALKELYNAIGSCIDLTPELMQSTLKTINKALGNENN